jgi:5-methyltetrahydrofolate--homocysteine methyltransferase
MADVLAKLAKALENGDAKQTTALVQEALAAGTKAKAILDQALFPGMDEVGRLFRDGEFFLPEVLLAARAMNQALTLLEPHLAAGGASAGKVAIGTVAGDMHDIGKNILGIMLRGAGFQVIDLGADVSADKFVAAAREHKPIAIGLSALLTTTAPGIKDVVTALDHAGLRGQVKVLAGGAALSADYARELGADAYSPDAYGALELLKGA